ncbi:MAG TPA: type II toxin-antitoxin system RelE/ParE family toxin [Turneriella sp.]|nr:type II toxin-antitoxin system RelE/ParE family toxin [Turneriella sp.]
MPKNEIIWAKYAYADLDGILDRINRNNPENVPKIYQKIMSKIKSLETFSNIGRVIPELERLNIFIFREIFTNPWRIFYRAEKQRVYILAIFDGRRDLEEIIIKRLLFEKS